MNKVVPSVGTPWTKGITKMISTYQRLQRQRDAGEIEGGFTLIELLIVIVVLGILAAVVIFALGGITGKSAVASCQADGATVSTALAAFNAQNPTILTNVAGAGGTAAVPPATYAAAIGDYAYYSPVYTGTAPAVLTSWSVGSATPSNTVGQIAVTSVPADNVSLEAVLSASSNGGPYVQSWPNSPSHYGYVLAWTQTAKAVSGGAQATWSAQLYVVTGSTYTAGSGTTAATYTTGSIDGNLNQTRINTAVPTGNTLTPAATAIVGLYAYSGPGVCTVVS
jgi:prepilin-type N-terminal cleavage/methylation domain-containing protein